MDNTIGKICNITTGKLDANQAVKGGDYPFFTCAKYPDEIDCYAYEDDVVLVAGNNAKGNFHVSRYKGKFNAYQRTYILTAKPGYNIDFVYYALQLELKRLKERSQGSQTKFLTMPILTGISLRDFTPEQQKTIAEVLLSLDEKIKNNHKVISELEKMANTLYEYWFIQFDFPSNSGKPYKSNSGAMEYNNELKREIPENWVVKPLSSYLNCNLNKLSSKHDLSILNYLDTSNLTSNVIDEIQTLEVGKDKIPSRAKMIVNHNDILYSTVRPNQLHYGLIKEPYNNMVASTGFSVLSHKSNSNYNSFFYLYLTSVANTQRLIKISESSKSSYPAISPDDIGNLKVALPKDDELLDNFCSLINPVFDKISESQKEIKELNRIRDWLLPMLMNGQVTVK